ncbi:uncharacterized protein NEPG_00497 [Nematocida parisii ERTm1]|uniref:t-SNARE coiled-coil homology domain-containing protein n=1 Tax=Nematocida parisii (strain ERTm3) TaxID=935791 RepID=I3EHL9_NEMP3|nr:uncharacterized protein NEPG_00497 [Nematocida parisii ERTm1]EIJ88716.1 hypothetical protein NEQG_01406 [Nematocida parisii ERTm3]EIJ94972.1 hypothetical protein NEPG_00497 [Nematocida parisii ERTm1]|eukprot:XP_013058328.1 hypothetical protein NEPG_00497 [Nematocida parisii ERTm1]
MDRTREFRSLITTTNIMQNRVARPAHPSITIIQDISAGLEELEGAVAQRRKISPDEISNIERLLEFLFEQFTEESGAEEISKSVEIALKHKHTGFVLRLRSILKKHKENEQRKNAALYQEEQRRARPQMPGMQQETGYVQREIQREEMSSIRRREFESLEQHINELGQMVTEVSMHISLQGEKVDLIDGLFTKAKSNLRGGSYELRGALDNVNKKRRTILLVFGVLFGILLIKYLRWI